MTATETTTNGKSKAARNPFEGLSCPECGSPDATIRMELNESFPACSCSECEAEFTPREAYEALMVKAAAWEKLVRWVEMAPTA